MGPEKNKAATDHRVTTIEPPYCFMQKGSERELIRSRIGKIMIKLLAKLWLKIQGYYAWKCDVDIFLKEALGRFVYEFHSSPSQEAPKDKLEVTLSAELCLNQRNIASYFRFFPEFLLVN